MSLSTVTTSGGYVSKPSDNQISLGFLDGRYLQVTGSNSMSGNLNVGGFKLNNVLDPTLSTDGATKNYVDTKVATVATVVNIKYKSLSPLFPSSSTNISKNGWNISSNSEYSGSFLACN